MKTKSLIHPPVINLNKTIEFLFIFFIVIVISCDESEKSIGHNNDDLNYKLCNELKHNIKVYDGILSFPDKATFNQTLVILESEDIAWNKKLSVIFNKISESEAIEGISSLKYDIYKVFRIFEEYYNYQSLRTIYENELKNWLNSEMLDSENDPDTKYVNGNALKTLLNKEGNVIIDDTLYSFYGNEYIFQLSDWDIYTLNYLKNNPTEVINLKSKWDNINLYDIRNLQADDCYSNHTVTVSNNYKIGYYVKDQISVNNYIVAHYIKGEIWHYKLEGSKWKLCPVENLSVYISGTFKLACDGMDYPFDNVEESGDDKVSHLTTSRHIGQSFVAKKTKLSSWGYLDDIMVGYVDWNW